MVKKVEGSASSSSAPVIQFKRDKKGNLSQVTKRASASSRGGFSSATSSQDIRTPSMRQRMQTIESMQGQPQGQYQDYNSISNQLDGMHLSNQFEGAYSRSFDQDQIRWANYTSSVNSSASYEQQQVERPILHSQTARLDGPELNATEETEDEAPPPPLHKRQTLARQFIQSAIAKKPEEQLDDLWRALKHLSKFEVSKLVLSPFKNSQTKCANENFKCPEASVVRFSIDGDSSKYHANYITLHSMPEAKLIASQHPPKNTSGQSNYMKMLFCIADVVFDIRSHFDMTKSDVIGYLPVFQNKLVTGDIETIKGRYRDYSNIIRERNVTLRFKNLLEKNLKVFQYRRWPDASITTSDGLRQLADLLGAQLVLGKRVLIHCCMGVGRTGSLITYFDARKQLLDAGKQVTLEDIHSLVFKNLLGYRQERGEIFIQKQEQFKLVIDTLRDDMQQAGLLVDESNDSLGIMDLVSISG